MGVTDPVATTAAASWPGLRLSPSSSPNSRMDDFLNRLSVAHGSDGPRVSVREGWEVEATEVRVVSDYRVGVADRKAGVTGAGGLPGFLGTGIPGK